MKVDVGIHGLIIRGKVDFVELDKMLKKRMIFQFGYYGDSTIEWDDDRKEYVVINTVTGAVKYRGGNLREAVNIAKGTAERYNELNDKYFHNDLEKKVWRGF